MLAKPQILLPLCFVGQDNVQSFPFAEENQCVIEVCCHTLQLSTCPVIESQIQLHHSGFISRSCLHCSDEFLHSFPLKPSCPGTKCLGPITPTSVFTTEILWLVSRIVHRQLQVPLAPWPHLYHQLKVSTSWLTPFAEDMVCLQSICRCSVTRAPVRPFFDLTSSSFFKAVRRMLTLLGHKDANKCTLKAFRAGRATSLAAAGSPIGVILAAGEWKSSAFFWCCQADEISVSGVLEVV